MNDGKRVRIALGPFLSSKSRKAPDKAIWGFINHLIHTCRDTTPLISLQLWRYNGQSSQYNDIFVPKHFPLKLKILNYVSLVTMFNISIHRHNPKQNNLEINLIPPLYNTPPFHYTWKMAVNLSLILGNVLIEVQFHKVIEIP